MVLACRHNSTSGSCVIGKYYLDDDKTMVRNFFDAFCSKIEQYFLAICSCPYAIKVFEPGDISTFWKMRYSDDLCFKKYPGQANLEAMEEFCPRVGGRVPGTV